MSRTPGGAGLGLVVHPVAESQQLSEPARRDARNVFGPRRVDGRGRALDVGQPRREHHQRTGVVVVETAGRDRRRDQHGAPDLRMKLRDPSREHAARAQSDDDDRVAKTARDLGRRVGESCQLVAAHSADRAERRTSFRRDAAGAGYRRSRRRHRDALRPSRTVSARR